MSAKEYGWPYGLPFLFRSIRIGAHGSAGSQIQAVWEQVPSAELDRITEVLSVEFDVTRTAAATPTPSVLGGWNPTGPTVLDHVTDFEGTWSKLSGAGSFAQVDAWTCSVDGMTSGQSVSLRFEYDDPVAAAELFALAAWSVPAASFMGQHASGTASVDDVWKATRLAVTVALGPKGGPKLSHRIFDRRV